MAGKCLHFSDRCSDTSSSFGPHVEGNCKSWNGNGRILRKLSNRCRTRLVPSGPGNFLCCALLGSLLLPCDLASAAGEALASAPGSLYCWICRDVFQRFLNEPRSNSFAY